MSWPANQAKLDPELAASDTAAGCDVSFHVDFEFKNAILQGIIGLVFNEAMQRIVRAFEARSQEGFVPASELCAVTARHQ